jgi:hypothetical protein
MRGAHRLLVALARRYDADHNPGPNYEGVARRTDALHAAWLFHLRLEFHRIEASGLAKTKRAELPHVVRAQRQTAFHTTLFLAALLALSGMAVWFVVSFALTGIDRARYREAAAEAARSGALAEIYRLPLAPNKEFYPHGGDDCLTLAMLIAPRETRLKAAVSPRVPVGQFRADAEVREWFPPQPFCDALAAMLRAEGALGAGGGQLPEMIYYHRYIHGTVTTTAVLLSVMSLKHATILLLGACYALLAWLVVAAALRLRSKRIAERRRAAAFLSIGLALALFYALPLFGRSFCFAPVDIVIIGFILYGLFRPLGRISQDRLVVSAALFGTAIAILDHLVGGIPMALAVLLVLVVLGEAEDRAALIRRLVLALAAFLVAVLVCLTFKQLVVLAIWGPDTLVDFVGRLGQRTGGGVTAELSDSVKQRLDQVGLSLAWLDANFASRIVFAAIMLVYSAFILGWGSHVLGAAIVIPPVPLLLLLTYRAVRRRVFRGWPLELLVIAGAAMVPFAWYLAFLNHTILHSSFMVRPLALSAGLVAVAWIYAHHPGSATLARS